VDARRAGIGRLFTEASELARPVFERAGYALLHRRDFTIAMGDEHIPIHNYAMEKALA
jgi:putative acetyltransferase